MVGISSKYGDSIVNLPEPYAEINFYSYPPGFNLELHHHLYYQFIFVTGGCLEISFKLQTFSLEKGQLIIIPPQIPHSLNTHMGCSQFGINLQKESDHRGIIPVLTRHFNKVVHQVRVDLLGTLPELRNNSRHASQLSMLKVANILDHILLSTIDMISCLRSQDFRDNLLDILNRDFSSKLTLQHVAKELSMSQSQLERLTHREFGVGVVNLFNQLKINKACSLLRLDQMSIKDISDHLGFCDQAHFCKFFKRKTNLTPNEYRKL